MFDWENAIAVGTMQGNRGSSRRKGKCASSRFDLRYTNLFCILDVTSVFFSCCESVLGDSLQFHQGNRGSLRF